MTADLNIMNKDSKVGAFSTPEPVDTSFLPPAQRERIGRSTPVRPSFTPQDPVESEVIATGGDVGVLDTISDGFAESLLGIGLDLSFDSVQRDDEVAKRNEALSAYAAENPVSHFLGTMAGRFGGDTPLDVAINFATTGVLKVVYDVMRMYGTSAKAALKVSNAIKWEQELAKKSLREPDLLHRTYRNVFEGGGTEIIMESVLQELGKPGSAKDILLAGIGGAVLSPAFSETFRMLTKLPGWASKKWSKETEDEVVKVVEEQTGEKLSPEDLDEIRALIPQHAQSLVDEQGAAIKDFQAEQQMMNVLRRDVSDVEESFLVGERALAVSRGVDDELGNIEGDISRLEEQDFLDELAIEEAEGRAASVQELQAIREAEANKPSNTPEYQRTMRKLKKGRERQRQFHERELESKIKQEEAEVERLVKEQDADIESVQVDSLLKLRDEITALNRENQNLVARAAERRANRMRVARGERLAGEAAEEASRIKGLDKKMSEADAYLTHLANDVLTESKAVRKAKADLNEVMDQFLVSRGKQIAEKSGSTRKLEKDLDNLKKVTEDYILIGDGSDAGIAKRIAKVLGTDDDLRELAKGADLDFDTLRQLRNRLESEMRKDADLRENIKLEDARIASIAQQNPINPKGDIGGVAIKNDQDLAMFAKLSGMSNEAVKMLKVLFNTRAKVVGQTMEQFYKNKKLRYTNNTGESFVQFNDAYTLINVPRNTDDAGKFFHEIGHILEQDLTLAERDILAKAYFPKLRGKHRPTNLFGEALSEKFANDFVKYLDEVGQGREMKGISNDLKKVFNKIAGWIKDVYGTLFGKTEFMSSNLGVVEPGVDTSASVRDMFDSLFDLDRTKYAKDLDGIPSRAEFLNNIEGRGKAKVRRKATPASDADLRVKVGTLFSGGGTLEAALPKHKGVFASEYDLRRAEAYYENFGHWPDTRDIHDVPDAELVAAFSDVDMCSFSPVCVRFSSMAAARSKKPLPIDMESARKVALIIDEARPRAVNIENAPAYVDSPEFKLIRDALDRQGYKYGDENVFDAMDFGGATRRKRMVFRAVREGELPQLPRKTGPKDWYEVIKDDLESPDVKSATVSATDKKFIDMGVKSGRLTRELPIYTTGIGSGSYSNSGGPTTAFLAGNGKPKVFMPDGRVLSVTPRMMAKLMDLPDSYKLPKPDTLARSIIGNGVNGMITKRIIAPLMDQANLQRGEAVSAEGVVRKATTAEEATALLKAEGIPKPTKRQVERKQVETSLTPEQLRIKALTEKDAVRVAQEANDIGGEIEKAPGAAATVTKWLRERLPKGFVSGIYTLKTMMEMGGRTLGRKFQELQQARFLEDQYRVENYDTLVEAAKRNKFKVDENGNSSEIQDAMAKAIQTDAEPINIKLEDGKDGTKVVKQEEALLLHLNALDGKANPNAQKAMENSGNLSLKTNGYRFNGEKTATKFDKAYIDQMASEQWLHEVGGEDLVKLAATMKDAMRESGERYASWYKEQFGVRPWEEGHFYFPKFTEALSSDIKLDKLVDEDGNIMLDAFTMEDDMLEELASLVSKGDQRKVMQTLADTTTMNHKRRGLGQLKYQNPFDAMVKYMDQQSRMRAMAKPLAEAQIIMKSKPVMQKFKNNVGEDVYASLNHILNNMAGNLGNADPLHGKWASKLYKGQIYSALSWNLSTPFKQFPSIALGLDRLTNIGGGPQNVTKYLGAAMGKGGDELHQKLMQISPTYRVRYTMSGQSPDLSDAKIMSAFSSVFGDSSISSAITRGGGPLSKKGALEGGKAFIEKGMHGIRWADSGVIRALYLAAVDDIEIQKGRKLTEADNAEVEKLVATIIADTQPSFHPMERTTLQNSRDFLSRQLAMFSSPSVKFFNSIHQDFSVLRQAEIDGDADAIKAAKKRINQTAAILAFQSAGVAAVGSAASLVKSEAFDQLKSEEHLAQRDAFLESHGLETVKYWDQVFRGAFGNLPYTGQFLSEGLKRGIFGDGFDLEVMPINYINDMYNWLGSIGDESFGRNSMELLESVSKVTGTPYPLVQTGKALLQ